MSSCLKFIFVWILLVFFSLSLKSQIIYVKQDATGANNGTSWTDAYTDLSTALSNASAGDTIWVAAGTYKPTASTSRSAHFSMVSYVPLFGGFAGNETTLEQRDFVNNQTILSGDIGVENDQTDNSYAVIFAADSTLLDGFTIRYGFNDATDFASGLVCYSDTNFVVRNCKFEHNYSDDKGGALYITGSSVNIKVENCTFSNNGYYNSQYTNKGGAIYTETNIEVNGCIFEFNHANSQGGAVNILNSTVNFTNCSFKNNSVINGNGGAVYNGGGSGYGKFTNCLFSLNNASSDGGAVYSSFIDTVINCTFYTNSAQGKGGAFADNYYSSFIVNSIFYNNNSNYYNLNGTTTNLAYSYFDKPYAAVNSNGDHPSGEGVIFTPAPRFADADGDDFHLLPGSGGIDAANGNFAPAFDKDGKARYDDFFRENTGIGSPAYSDMGAYECRQNSPMKGDFQIGASAPLFHSFNQAVDSLISVGVDSVVTFSVLSGTYNEQIEIPLINSITDDYTITFRSESGDSTDVILTYSATQSDKNYTVFLNKAKHIVFKNITIKAENSTYANVIRLSDSANDNRFEGNIISGVAGQGSLICREQYPDSANAFINNLFLNGQIAINLKGSYHHPNGSVRIEANTFLNQTQTVVFVEYYKNIQIINNQISSNQATKGIYFTGLNVNNGIYLIKQNHIRLNTATALEFRLGKDSTVISENKIILDNGGSALSSSYLEDDTLLIYNNFILLNTTGNDAALDFYDAGYANNCLIALYFNTVRITGNSNASTCLKTDKATIDIYNNILSNEAGGSITSGYVGQHRNYNCYYTSGNKNVMISGYNLEFYFNYSDTNSFFLKPYFLNDTTYLTQNATLNNRGSHIDGYDTDIEGNARNATTPDVGCYEYSPSLTPMSGIYTVGQGKDFSTISRAIDTIVVRGVNAPVTLNIENGQYDEQVFIPEIPSLTGSNTLTLQSASGDSTTVILTYNPDTTYDLFTLKLYNAHNVTIKNITITTGNTSCDPVVIERNAYNNTITGNIIRGASGTVNLLYKQDNYVYSRDSNNVISNNWFVYGGTGVNLQYSSGDFVTNNIFSQLWYGVNVSQSDGCVISNNTINQSATDGRLYGIKMNSVQKAKVFNNTINQRSNEDDDRGYGILLQGCSGTIAFNSVKVGGESYALQVSSSVTVLNNILIADKVALSCTDTTNDVFDNNILFAEANNQSYPIYFISWHTLEQWQNYGFGQNSIIKRISFQDDSLLFSDDPWLNNQAQPVAGITIDKNGHPRDALNPDIGAYEFNGHIPLSGVYTIGSDGDFVSFSQVADSLHLCGVQDSAVFVVKDGEYNEQIRIKDVDKQPTDAKIVFVSQANDYSTVSLQYNATNSNDNFVVLIDSVSNVEFKNITIKALNNDFANVVVLSNITDSIVFEGNRIEAPSDKGSLFYADTTARRGITIVNNNLVNGQYGIVLKSSSAGYCNYTAIKGNTFTNQRTYAIYANRQTDGDVSANIINHPNQIDDTLWVGIGLIHSSHLQVSNNMISFNASAKSAGIHLFSSDFINVYFNSVDIYGLNAPQSRALNSESSNYINVNNNIFSNNAQGLVFYTTSPLSSDYNAVFTNGNNFAYNGQFIETFDNWQSETSQDEHSLLIEPPFVSDTDLHLKPNLYLHYGIPVSVTTDIDGQTRHSSSPYIGADELVWQNSSPLSGNYTIGSNGDFETFTQAVIALTGNQVAGDVTFLAKPGQYNEQFIIDGNLINYTNGKKQIKFTSADANAENVTIFYAADSLFNYIAEIKNISRLVFSDITFKALDSSYGQIILMGNNVDSIYFINNKFLGIENNDPNKHNIAINMNQVRNDMTDKIVLDGNSFTGGNDALQSNSSKLSLNIVNNRFTGQNAEYLAKLYLKNCEISHNYISSDKLSYGFYIQNQDQVNIANNKLIMTNVNSAIYAYNAVIKNNVIYVKDGGQAINLYYGSSKILNNTILTENSRECINFVSDGGTQTIMNNCLVTDYYRIINSTDNHHNYQNYAMDYNNCYSTNPDFDFNAMTNVIGGNEHSVSFMPKFDTDTSLYANALLMYRTGTALTEVTEDFNGNPRNDPPCIGAYEFTNPVFALPEDTVVFCYFDDNYNVGEYTYNAGIGYDSYLWSTGADSALVIIDTSTLEAGINKLWLTVGLNGQYYTDTLWVNYDKPDALPTDRFCFFPGDTLEITAGQAREYLWSTGDTTQSIVITENSNYWVEVTDQYQCKAKEYVTLESNNYLASIHPDDTTINTNQTIQLYAVDNFDNYIYDFCRFRWSTSDTTYSINLNGSDFGEGTHKVDVKVINRIGQLGCFTSDTATIIVQAYTGIGPDKTLKILIYPNPATDYLIVRSIDYQGPIEISIYNINGQKVYYTKNKSADKNSIINLSNIKPGTYLINIKVNNRSYREKFIITGNR